RPSHARQGGNEPQALPGVTSSASADLLRRTHSTRATSCRTIILLCAAHNGPPRPAVLAVRRSGTVMPGPPPGRCWTAGGAVQACGADGLGCVEARRVWVKWRVGACSSSPESASAPYPASPTTVSWRGSGCPAPSPDSLRADFKAGPVPAVAPALADGWSY